jgi:hypothetical protein
MNIKIADQLIELYNEVPQAEGFYIWFCNMFPETATPKLVQVYWKPKHYSGGIEFGGYWAVHRGDDVRKFNRSCDFWSKKLEW